MTWPAPGDERRDPGGAAVTGGPRRLPPHHVVKRTRMGTVWFAAASFAAVLGILLAAIPGIARIIQLRILARRHRAIDAGRADGTRQPTEAPVSLSGYRP
jgi:hypothetical protein